MRKEQSDTVRTARTQLVLGWILQGLGLFICTFAVVKTFIDFGVWWGVAAVLFTSAAMLMPGVLVTVWRNRGEAIERGD